MKSLAKKPVLRAKNRGGAPFGNRNAWKTGAHSKPNRDLFAQIRAFKRHVRSTLAKIDAELAQRGR
jgi:uncharacterized protein YjcR